MTTTEISDQALDWPTRRIEAGQGHHIICAGKITISTSDPRVSAAPVEEKTECGMPLDESFNRPRDFLMHLQAHIHRVHRQ